MTHATPPPYPGPMGPPPGFGAPPAPPRKKWGPGKIIAAVLFSLLALCMLGGGIVALAANDKPTNVERALSEQDQANRAAASAAPTSSPTPSPAATTTSPAAAPTTTKPTPTTPAPVLISDGTYTVGEDMPAGRYKVVERAGDSCYWARTKGDAGDIVDNGLGGGFPTFTARKGEQVEIMGCPEFERLGK